MAKEIPDENKQLLRSSWPTKDCRILLTLQDKQLLFKCVYSGGIMVN